MRTIGRDPFGSAQTGNHRDTAKPAGEEIWIQTDKIPYCDKAGTVVGLVVMAQDITQRKRAEESLRLLGSAVDQSNESITITDAVFIRPGPESYSSIPHSRR